MTRICVIDDDDAVRGGLSLLLRAAGHDVACFESAAAFLHSAEIDDDTICLLLDVRMPGISGLDLLARLAADNRLPPTIVLTGHGDVPMAVSAMKLGAMDFLEKPVDDERLLALIDRASALIAERNATAAVARELERRLAALTRREREIMELIVAGRANKWVAIELGISERTVEVHRHNVMRKMGVRSLAELVTAVGSRAGAGINAGARSGD